MTWTPKPTHYPPEPPGPAVRFGMNPDRLAIGTDPARRRRVKIPGMAVTYFIATTDCEPTFVKIGITSLFTAQKRLEQLQTGSPFLLRIIREVEGDFESWFHSQFGHRHMRGEWFEFDDLMLTLTPPSAFERAEQSIRATLTQCEHGIPLVGCGWCNAA